MSPHPGDMPLTPFCYDSGKRGLRSDFWAALLFSIVVHAAFIQLPPWEGQPVFAQEEVHYIELVQPVDFALSAPAGGGGGGLGPIQLDDMPDLSALPDFSFDASAVSYSPDAPVIAAPPDIVRGGPVSGSGTGNGEDAPGAGGVAEDELYRFVPGTVSAWLKNHDRIQRELERRYPQHMRLSGVEGRVELQLWIDERGKVQRYAVKSASNNAFRKVAEQVIPLLEIAPPVNRGTPVSAILDLPIVFRVRY